MRARTQVRRFQGGEEKEGRHRYPLVSTIAGTSTSQVTARSLSRPSLRATFFLFHRCRGLLLDCSGMEGASSSFIIGSSGLWKHDYDLGLYGTSMSGICYFMAEQYWEAWGLSESVVFHVFYLVSCWFLGFCWCLFWVWLFCVFVAFWWHLGSRFTYILIVGINNLNQRIDDRQSFKRARHWQKKNILTRYFCSELTIHQFEALLNVRQAEDEKKIDAAATECRRMKRAKQTLARLPHPAASSSITSAPLAPAHWP